MRSESEVRWIRAKNHVGLRTVTTDWHAIIPGQGSMDVPPGTACGIGLSGAIQTVEHSAITTLDGHQHDRCVAAVDHFLEGIAMKSPGPLRQADPPKKYAPPKNPDATRTLPVQKL